DQDRSDADACNAASNTCKRTHIPSRNDLRPILVKVVSIVFVQSEKSPVRMRVINASAHGPTSGSDFAVRPGRAFDMRAAKLSRTRICGLDERSLARCRDGFGQGPRSRMQICCVFGG